MGNSDGGRKGGFEMNLGITVKEIKGERERRGVRERCHEGGEGRAGQHGGSTPCGGKVERVSV